ncbi:hypothetical protein EUW85_23725 [Salmonella enterica subsp. enterica serovar Ngili]|nr:hypothetical protein [Salmonella enterica subsp. enterica serovar Ngili]
MKKIELQPLSARRKASIMRSALSSSSAGTQAISKTQERTRRDVNSMLNHAFRVASEAVK